MLLNNEVIEKPTSYSVMNSWVHTCDVCGKQFFVSLPDLYVYKEKVVNKPRWYCGYTCSRVVERPKKGKRGETCCANQKTSQSKYSKARTKTRREFK